MPAIDLRDEKQFREAVEYFRRKAPMSKAAWAKLTKDAKQKAFTVAHVARADVIQQVMAAIDRAVSQGATLADFRKAVGPTLEKAWGSKVSNKPFRIETIFRTNVQTAYAAGRYRQLTDPVILKVRPYWTFDGVADNRQSPVCAACNGVVLPADDPWWKAHQPPLHHCCRSSIRSLRASQAEKIGITAKPPAIGANEGFGATPDVEQWKPDLSKYPAELRDKVEKALQP